MENTITTSSVNMFYMADNGLIKAINEKMDARNFGVRTAAAAIGVSHPTLSRVLSGEEPTFEFCVKVAHFLGMPIEATLRFAGLLPPVPERTEQTEQLIYLFEKLGESERQVILNIVRSFLN